MILTRPGPTCRVIAETEWTRHCNSAEMSHCTLWSSPSRTRTRTLELKGNGGYRTVERVKRGIFTINMRDRSQNRKPLQRGRNLSIEAIQAVQALKRAKRDDSSLERVFESKVRRLLKLDMIAVLKQLLNQNECLLALKVCNQPTPSISSDFLLKLFNSLMIKFDPKATLISFFVTLHPNSWYRINRVLIRALVSVCIEKIQLFHLYDEI